MQRSIGPVPRHTSPPTLVFIALLLAGLFLPSHALAQFANADLAGTVTSSDGQDLPGVTVTARNEASGISRTTVTAANGAPSPYSSPSGVASTSSASASNTPRERKNSPTSAP